MKLQFKKFKEDRPPINKFLLCNDRNEYYTAILGIDGYLYDTFEGGLIREPKYYSVIPKLNILEDLC